MALAPLSLAVDRESSEHGCRPRQTVHWPNRTAVSCGTSPAQPDLVRSLPAFACCLAALAVSPPALCAQAPPPRLEPGARVRLDVSSLGRITGTLVAWEPDTLVVKEDGQAEGLRLIILADSVSRIDVRRERRMTLEGAGVGLLVGTLFAVTASPDWVDENGDCTPLVCLAYKVSPKLATRIAVLGLVGALAGVIAGSETKTHTWSRVPLERLDVGPAPGGGLAFGVRISF